jgi:exodeoxyribonuclease V alpha subunit
MQQGRDGEMTGEGDQQLLFGDGDTPLWVHPAQLAGAVEPALALTVHKAQGSEAAELIVLLGGEHQDPRLLYTALTRARQQALLITASSARAVASR